VLCPHSTKCFIGLFIFPHILIVVLSLSSTPRALPLFVHGVFLEKTKQKIVISLDVIPQERGQSLSLSRAFEMTGHALRDLMEGFFATIVDFCIIFMSTFYMNAER